MQFYRVKSTLTRANLDHTFFSQGNTFTCEDPCVFNGQELKYYHYIKARWTFRMHLVHGTDLTNYKDITNSPTVLDDYTLTWTRIWADKKYHDEFLTDPYTKPIWDRELERFRDLGIVYREECDCIPAKQTSNGRWYLGDYYFCRPELNSITAINT